MEDSPIPSPSDPGCLVVTGMHHSGTWILASLLRETGVDLGEHHLPAGEADGLGCCGDHDLLELQGEMLLACTIAESGWRDWGWTESQRLDFSRLASFRPRAEALVRRRQAATRPWGWTDPRTTVLLGFWDEILPNARYIFLYREVWEVASSIAALHRPPFLDFPGFVPRIWCFYNREVLGFYRRHRDRCLLLEAGSLLSRPDEALALVRSKLGVSLKEWQDGAAILRGIDGAARLGDTRGAASLRRLSAMIYPREAQVWADLERSADLAAGFHVAANPAPVAAGFEVATHAAPADTRSATPEAPTVTVVIPCFNHGEFVLAAVASVEDSEGATPELLIVNDGSTDQFTIDVLERLRAVGYRILDQPNRGLSAARNAGIRAARGRYILPLDADNRIHSSYLRRAAERLEAAPEVGVVYGDATLSGGGSGVWRMPDFNLDEMATGNRIDACGVFRREVWQQCGGYDEDVALGWEDWDFWLSVAEKGWRFVHVPEVLFDYRLHGESTSANGARQDYRRLMLEFIIAKHPAIFQSRLPKMFAEKDSHWRQAEARAVLLERNLDEVHRDLEAARRELQGCRDDLDATRGELATARSELAAARSELLGFREHVGFMTGTRAWRLRARLLRLRVALGLQRHT
jgi:glycosyltransferase involved in cell wall biosynthesis